MTMTISEIIPAGTVADHPSAIRYLAVGEIERDTSVNTRDPNETWIARRTGDNFSAMKLGTITVSERREDGRVRYIVLDGQNRCELVKRQAGRDAKVECKIYEGLTREEEARLFLGLNDNRPPNAISKFLARVTAGDIAARKIADVIADHGYRVAPERECGVLSCIQQLEIIWQRDVKKRGSKPPLALERTLTVVNAAWRPNDKSRWVAYGDGTHRAVLAGIGMIFYLHGDSVDVQRMIERLTAFKGGPESLLHRAFGLKGAKSLRSVGDGVAEVVLGEYNRGLKVNALPYPS